MSGETRITNLIAAAKEWAAAGIPVFPVMENKAPLTKNGFKDAVTDPNEVTALFESFGDAAWGIGGSTGNGMFVVDVDLYKGDHVKEWLNENARNGMLPLTREHKTTSGGMHLFYSGEAPDCAPVSGVEIKSDGGYVVLPGSPGYSEIRPGMEEAPKALLDFIRSSATANRGSSKAALEAAILSGADFHATLTQLSARMASEGADQAEIQASLTRLMSSSAAAFPKHKRHSRWSAIMEDKGGEFSRICSSAYLKFNDDAVVDAFGESAELAALTAVVGSVFSDDPNPDEPAPTPTVPKVNSDVWPFEGQGYFADTTHNLSDVKFTMYPIYTENETVVLFAEPKTGKTAVSLTTALHIACGFDLGSLKVTEAGPVLYYALEGSHAIRLRIASWKKVMKERGVTLPSRIPLFTIEKRTNFVKEDDKLAAAAKIIAADEYSRKLGPGLKAIFIDTLTKAMPGADQNSVEDTSSLFEIVGLVREAGVTATIIFVHHKSRQGNVRGSSNIEADPDMLLDVSKKGELIKLKVARARSIEDGAIFHFNVSGVDLGKTKQGHPLTGMFVEPIDAPNNGDDDVDYAEIQQLVKRREVITQLGGGIGRADAQAVVAEWHKRGLIKGRTIRNVEVAPTLNLAHVKEALSKVAEDAGGSVFGDFLIRPTFVDKDLVAFKVLKAS